MFNGKQAVFCTVAALFVPCALLFAQIVARGGLR